jgi:CheY-like chemotaxis protein
VWVSLGGRLRCESTIRRCRTPMIYVDSRPVHVGAQRYSEVGKRILVADDDPGILNVLTLILEEFGYDVTPSKDGSLLMQPMNPPPDLVLLDIVMAGADGRAICRHLKSNKGTEHIPVLLISANRSTEEIALDCGANGFIRKPFETDELIAMVEEHLSEPKP